MDVRLNLINVFRQLDKEPKQFWIDLISRYLLDSKHVAVSFPSLKFETSNHYYCARCAQHCLDLTSGFLVPCMQAVLVKKLHNTCYFLISFM